MKRDPDLIRELLSFFEANLDGKDYITTNEIHLDNYSAAQISYHIGLLADANFIHAKETILSHGPSFWVIFRMTPAGHDFIEAARDDTRWNNAKEIMAKTGGFALEVMKAVLIELLKKQAMTGL